MSVVRGGDIRQIKIDGREYDPAPEASCTIRIGGFANDVKRAGNGAIHSTQKRTMAGIEGLGLSIDDERGDLEALQAVADKGIAVPVTLDLASGKSYAGSLILVAEDLGKKTDEGSAEVSLYGERFEQV